MHKLFQGSLFFLLLLLTMASGVTQNPVKSLSLPHRGLTVKEAIEQIEKQTGYSIAYEQSGLDLDRVISLPLKKADIHRALQDLLKNTGYTYKIKGYHIILLPDTQKTTHGKDYPPFPPGLTEDDRTYLSVGTVLDSTNREPLPYATVTLLDKAGGHLATGITDSKGSFRIKTARQSSHLVVSFVGYKTFSQETDHHRRNGSILLVPDVRELNGATITAEMVEHKVDRNVYLVTGKMREQAFNAQELLDQLPGVRFDQPSNTIRVGNATAVLLLIDGVQQPTAYIKNLPPGRILKIEVITEPAGRYLSDGYAAIINFILQKDYVGYDVNVRNFAMLSAGHRNGGDWLANEQPGGGVTYTKEKLNVFANYTYAKTRLNTPVWEKQLYPGLMEMYPIKAETANANNRYDYRANYVSGGINYQLAPDHSLSFQGDYAYRNTGEENRLKYNVYYPKGDSWSQLSTFREDATKDRDYVMTVFYQGEIARRIKVYSDFTYNYYSNDVTNDFLSGTEDYSSDRYRENKKYTKFNLESTYAFSSKMTLNAGYVNVWRRYLSENRDDVIYLYYNEWRNQFFSYFQYLPHEKLAVKIGANVEYIRTYSETKNNDWDVLPYLQLNFKANRNINLNISYHTDITYPTLFQLSPLTTILSSMTRQSGNPELRSAVRHTVSTRLSLGNWLTIEPMFRFTPKSISEVFTQGAWSDAVFSSFNNIKVKQYTVHGVYNQPIGRHFNLKNSLIYYYNEAGLQDINSSYHGWMFDSEIGYFNPKWGLDAKIGYHRNIDKNAMLQGYQMVNLDSWQINLNKQFWNRQASLSVSYLPPISWGTRDKLEKEIKTPFYVEKSVQQLKPYGNMFILSFNLRFNSGKKTKATSKQSTTEKEERAKRAVEF